MRSRSRRAPAASDGKHDDRHARHVSSRSHGLSLDAADVRRGGGRAGGNRGCPLWPMSRSTGILAAGQPDKEPDSMTTTKQSTWGATLRTTILLASLSGLLIVIGALIGGPSTAALFLGIALLINLGSYFFSDKLALGMSRRQADRGVGKPAALPDRPRTDDPRRAADAAPLHDPPGPAQRLRDRPQPEALGRRRHPRHHQAALRGRAARRPRPRAHPRPQPRHPDPVGRLGDRRRDHLRRLHAALVRRRRQLAAGPRRLAGDGHPGAGRGEHHPARDLAPARVRGRRRRCRNLRQPGVARQRPAAPRAGGDGRCR